VPHKLTHYLASSLFDKHPPLGYRNLPKLTQENSQEWLKELPQR